MLFNGTKTMISGLIWSCILSICTSEIVYDGYEVWRAYPLDGEEVEFMKSFGTVYQVDYWKEPTVPEHHVDFLVPPEYKGRMRTDLTSRKIRYTKHINDVKKLIDSQFAKRKPTARKSGRILQSILDFDYSIYHDYDEILEWINTVVSEFPTIAQKRQIGVTYEGRPMQALEFKKPGTATKPVMFIDSLIHSREWITTASLLFILKEMLTNPDYQHMMDDVDWYFVPMINIDGFVHTHEVDRLWRKTKTSGASSMCVGVDGNRNWNSYWSVSGSSDNPCSYSYHGPTPTSEPVIRHLAEYILSVGKIDAFVSTHSYSQFILYPYNYADIKTEDYDLQDAVAKRMSDAMYSIHNVRYTYGIGATTLYEFSGTTTDWTYDVAGIKLSYLFELRDTGEYGFLLPPEQIIPTGEEYLAGLEVLKNEITNN